MSNCQNSAGPLGDFLELLAGDHLVDLYRQTGAGDARRPAEGMRREAIIDEIHGRMRREPELTALLRIPGKASAPRLKPGETVFFGDLIRNSLDVVAEKSGNGTRNLLRVGRGDGSRFQLGLPIRYFNFGEAFPLADRYPTESPEVLPPLIQWPCATLVEIPGDLEIPDDVMVIFEARELRIGGTLRMGARSAIVGLTPCIGADFTLAARSFNGPAQQEDTAQISVRAGDVPPEIRTQFQPRGVSEWTVPPAVREDILNLRDGRDGAGFDDEPNYIEGTRGSDGFCGLQNQPAGDGQSFGDGQRGRNGGNGRRGRRGGRLRVTFTAESAGHLLLDADGGQGGRGGQGGPGQSLLAGAGGDLPLTCWPGAPGRGGNAGRGGPGGDGGNGGRGGDGGEIELDFVPTSDNVAFFPIRARACGGSPGAGGSAGRPGVSTGGRGGSYLNPFGVGLYSPPGLDGQGGSDGSDGLPGLDGGAGLDGLIRVNGVWQPGCEWQGAVGG